MQQIHVSTLDFKQAKTHFRREFHAEPANQCEVELNIFNHLSLKNSKMIIYAVYNGEEPSREAIVKRLNEVYKEAARVAGRDRPDIEARM
jgi:hypothetical protein